MSPGERYGRAQSTVLGAVLLFGFLILLLSVVQAEVVPSQNAGVEFDHSQDVQSEFVSLRSGLLETATTGERTYNPVPLGTRYPTRLITVNPPPVVGTIETSEPRPITVRNGDGDDVSDSVFRGPNETRALVYSPAYNVLSADPEHTFENTVAFRREGDATFVESDQQLLSDGTVNIVPVEGELSERGIGAVSVDPVPGAVGSRTLEDPEIVVPTRFDQATWDELLAGELDDGESAVVDESAGTLTLDLEGTYTVVTTPVAVEGEPAGGLRDGGRLGNGNPTGGDGDGGQINPAGDGAVILAGVDSTEANQGRVTVALRNLGDEVRLFDRARVPFRYDAQANTDVDAFELVVDGEVLGTLDVGGNFVVLDAPIRIEPDETVDVTLRDPDGNQISRDLLSLASVDNRNRVSNYLFGVADDGSGGGSGGNGDQGDGSATRFESVEVEDVEQGAASDEDKQQDFAFTLAADLADGEVVVIDLEDAQRGDVLYESGDAIVEGGSGDAVLEYQNQNKAEIRYTSSGDSAGDQIDITVTGYESGDAQEGDELTVEFEDPDGNVATATFRVV